MQPTSHKIEALLAKRAALDARISRLKQRDTAADRRARSRALLLLGNALENLIKKAPGEAQVVRQLISQNLAPRDQELVLNYLFSTAPTKPAPVSDSTQQ